MSPEQQILSFMLMLARVSAFVGFLPIFARRQLPNQVKAGLAIGLTVFWYGTLPEDQSMQLPSDTVLTILYFVKEATIGFMLATIVGLIFVPARIAGSYIGQEIGLSLAAVTSPGSSDSSTIVTTILETVSIMLFFGMNLHHLLILTLHHSFLMIGSEDSLIELPCDLIVGMHSLVLEQGFAITAPIGICLMMVTFGLALLNRAAPSLNLFSVGMTLRIAFGLFCCVIFFPVMARAIVAQFESHQFRVEEFLFFFSASILQA